MMEKRINEKAIKERSTIARNLYTGMRFMTEMALQRVRAIAPMISTILINWKLMVNCVIKGYWKKLVLITLSKGRFIGMIPSMIPSAMSLPSSRSGNRSITS